MHFAIQSRRLDRESNSHHFPAYTEEDQLRQQIVKNIGNLCKQEGFKRNNVTMTTLTL
jgi:hypothetical protein